MPYPYKKMTEEDFAYIRSVTSEDRVWVGDEIAREFYRDEMPEYGVFPPELYVEIENRDEVSAIMKYAYENNIPVVCRGAGTGLAGGATCKYGGIMLSVMRMNRIFPVDHKNQTITCEPGALLLDVQAAAAAEGLFYPPDPGEKTASIGGNVITNAGGMKAVRYGLTRDFVRCIEAVLPDGSIMNFSSNVVKNTTGYDIKDLVIGSEGTLCILTQVTLKLLPAPTCSCTLVMPFGSLEECADMVPEVLALPFIPTAIEFLERELIDIVERNLGKLLPVRQGEAVLIVMYDASSRQELDSAVEAAAEAALAHGAIDCCIANTPERAASVWAVRGGGPGGHEGRLGRAGGVRRRCSACLHRGICQGGQAHRAVARHPRSALRPLRRRQHPYRNAARSGDERRGMEERNAREPDRAVCAVEKAGRPAFRRTRHRQRTSGIPRGVRRRAHDKALQIHQAGV